MRQAAANPDTPFDALIEEIDIGGPSLVRAAAKNFQDVLVVVSPADYRCVLEQLDREGGPSPEFRFDLARRAFAHTGVYDTAIAATLADDPRVRRRLLRARRPARPRSGCARLLKVRDLRYGENPHQRAAWYAEYPRYGFGAASVLQGKELSYTNLLDLDAALRIVLEFSEPAAAVIKHTNPCGAATGASAADAYVRARDADALAAFGGIVGLNRAIDAAAARAHRLHVHRGGDRAGGRRGRARGPRGQAEYARRHRRLRTHAGGRIATSGRSSGRCWCRARDRVTEAAAAWPDGQLNVVTKRQPTAAEWQALRFAWRICAHVKSNAVIFTAADRTLAIGAGQMSRVDAVQVARMKADERGIGAPARIRRGVGRVLPVPRRPRRRGRGRCDRRRAAGRVSARRRSHRRRRRTRAGDGVHRPTALPALSGARVAEISRLPRTFSCRFGVGGYMNRRGFFLGILGIGSAILAPMGLRAQEGRRGQPDPCAGGRRAGGPGEGRRGEGGGRGRGEGGRWSPRRWST